MMSGAVRECSEKKCEKKAKNNRSSKIKTK